MTSRITQLFLDAQEIINHSSQKSDQAREMFTTLFRDYLHVAYRDLRQQHTTQELFNRNFINTLCYLLSLAKDQSPAYTQKKIQHVVEQLRVIEQEMWDMRLTQFLCCRTEMKLRNKMLNCLVCGKQMSINKKMQRADKKDSGTKSTSYQALKHFESVFRSIFIQQAEDIPSDLIAELRAFMVRDQKTRVTIEDVRQYLKQVTKGRGSKFNKIDAALMQLLNGEEAVRLTPKEYNFIREVYQRVILIFYQNNAQQNNTPSASFLIRCIIEMLYKDQFPRRYQQLIKLIHVQKEQTVLKIQKTWTLMMRQIDAASIKQQFAAIMNR